MKRKAPVICAVAALALIVLFVYAKSTPRYSIYQFARAVHNRDAETALRYVDIDSVSENLAKSLLKARGASGKANKEIASAVSMNMPSIKEGIRNYLETVIRTGRADKESRAAFGDFDIYSVTPAIIWRLDVTRENSSALVRIKGKPEKGARMVKTGEGYWKFVEIIINRPGKD